MEMTFSELQAEILFLPENTVLVVDLAGDGSGSNNESDNAIDSEGVSTVDTFYFMGGMMDG